MMFQFQQVAQSICTLALGLGTLVMLRREFFALQVAANRNFLGKSVLSTIVNAWRLILFRNTSDRGDLRYSNVRNLSKLIFMTNIANAIVFISIGYSLYTISTSSINDDVIASLIMFIFLFINFNVVNWLKKMVNSDEMLTLGADDRSWWGIADLHYEESAAMRDPISTVSKIDREIHERYLQEMASSPKSARKALEEMGILGIDGNLVFKERETKATRYKTIREILKGR